MRAEFRATLDAFSDVLINKLIANEKKYGYNEAWKRDGWQPELVQHLEAHVKKGDPRDVAIYAMFAWHHGWKTSVGGDIPPPPEPPPGRVIREGFAPPLPPADVMRKELLLALYNLTRTLETPEHSQIMDDKDRKRLEQAKQALKKYQNIKDCLR